MCMFTATEHHAMMPNGVRRSNFPFYVCDWSAPRCFTFASAQVRSRDNDCIPEGSGSNLVRDTSYQT